MEKKNIQVVTWRGGNNFGTLLQCYSLVKYLSDSGYQVEYLKKFNLSKSYINTFKCILNYFGYFRYKENKEYSKSEQLKKINKFHNELPTRYIFTNRQLKNLIRTTDVFISGSDQIWNTNFSFTPFYFLDFAGSAKRISYASSLGSTSIKESCKDDVRGLLLKYKHIGVREQSAVQVLEELTQRGDIKQVVDPTFLLKPETWQDFCSKANIEFDIPECYIFCYFIGDNDIYKIQLADIQQKYDISKIIVVSSAENPTFSFEGCIKYENAGPKEFIYLLTHASLVCTDSFHATALSINNSISFVEFLRFQDSDIKSQNSRLYDLLNHYNLANRFYSHSNDEWTQLIDYQIVQNQLAKDRLDSIQYLISSIED